MCVRKNACVCVCVGVGVYSDFIWMPGVQTYKCMTLMCNYRRMQEQQ